MTPAEDAPVSLADLGWDAARDAETPARPGDTVGRIARVDRGWVTLIGAPGVERARMAAAVGRNRDKTARPAVGDWAVVRGGELAMILPRRSALVRGATDRGRDPKIARGAQIVAANVDRVFLVHSLDSPLRARRLERELVVVHEAGAEPAVVMTKLDLVDEPETLLAAVRDIVGDVAVHALSSATGAGYAELAAGLERGRTIALIGPSGAGKSSIVNRLLGAERLATGDVRAGDRRGRHTTVARELIVLPSGGVLVDTPGLRAVALWDADDGFEEAFADVEQLAARCKFADCRHRSEPGCAVRAAVAAGTLDPDRLRAYVQLSDELDQLADRGVERDREARRRADQRPEIPPPSHEPRR